MRGIQAHIENPVEDFRSLGMAVGEFLMNTLCPDAEHPLEFTQLKLSEDVKWCKSFMRPLSEQVWRVMYIYL